MVDIEARMAMRLRIMKAIFDATDGSITGYADALALGQAMGLSDPEVADACAYLLGEGLISAHHYVEGQFTPAVVQLTHRGVKEMEESQLSPEKATEHFPPAGSVIIHGDVIGSAIQSGSPGARQDVTIGDVNVGGIRSFLSELAARREDLGLPETESRELSAEVATLQAQIDSPRPKRRVITESLHTIRSLLEGVGGNLAAAPLLELIQHIHV
jgi:hypothetical protein